MRSSMARAAVTMPALPACALPRPSALIPTIRRSPCELMASRPGRVKVHELSRWPIGRRRAAKATGASGAEPFERTRRPLSVGTHTCGGQPESHPFPNLHAAQVAFFSVRGTHAMSCTYCSAVSRARTSLTTSGRAPSAPARSETVEWRPSARKSRTWRIMSEQPTHLKDQQVSTERQDRHQDHAERSPLD